MAKIEPKQIHLLANGSMIVRDATGQTVELPAGAEEKILAIISGIPSWQWSARVLDPRDVQRFAMVNSLL